MKLTSTPVSDINIGDRVYREEQGFGSVVNRDVTTTGEKFILVKFDSRFTMAFPDDYIIDKVIREKKTAA